MTSIRVSAQGRSYVFPPGVTVRIGRAEDSDVVLTAPTVGYRHARLVCAGDAWRLIDDEVGNGIWDGGWVGSLPVTGTVTALLGNQHGTAVKWLRPGPGSEELRKSITELIKGGRPPHPAFIWPIDMLSSDVLPGFGYLMPLLEPRFTSLAPILNIDTNPSFRTVAAIGLELVDAFAALHSAGLCYRDISFGNLRVDTEAREVAIIDVDNVGVDGEFTLVKGTGYFMAPEILRNEALPSTVTDLHSLAVLLFYLLMHGHPLEGVRADASYTWEYGGHISETELLVRNFGVHPLFIFDPDDRSNGPVPGTSVAAWWSIYPQQCRKVFTQAFTRGLLDASLDGRVIEGTWRRTLLALHDSVSACAGCGAPVYYDLAQPGQSCWHCHANLPAPPTLVVPGGTIVLSAGAVVTSHHLYRNREYRAGSASPPLPGPTAGKVRHAGH